MATGLTDGIKDKFFETSGKGPNAAWKFSPSSIELSHFVFRRKAIDELDREIG
jgi:hypothetical protein